MNALQNFFVDNLNGFALDQIPLFLFQLLAAGLSAFVFQFLLNKKMGEVVVEYAVLTAVSVALLAAVVKLNEPTAILGAAVLVLFLRNAVESKIEAIGLVVVVLLGIGCGVGSVVLTGLGALILYAVVFFTPLKK
jgi:hypothetical protein